MVRRHQRNVDLVGHLEASAVPPLALVALPAASDSRLCTPVVVGVVANTILVGSMRSVLRAVLISAGGGQE